MSKPASLRARCLRPDVWPPPDQAALRRSLQDDDLLQEAGALAGLARLRMVAGGLIFFTS